MAMYKKRGISINQKNMDEEINPNGFQLSKSSSGICIVRWIDYEKQMTIKK